MQTVSRHSACYACATHPSPTLAAPRLKLPMLASSPARCAYYDGAPCVSVSARREKKEVPPSLSTTRSPSWSSAVHRVVHKAPANSRSSAEASSLKGQLTTHRRRTRRSRERMFDRSGGANGGMQKGGLAPSLYIRRLIRGTLVLGGCSEAARS